MDNLIETNPEIMVGKPVIRGTRITVEAILEHLAAGETFEQILSQYPHLSREGLSSAVRFALETVRDDYPPQNESKLLLDKINEAYDNPFTEADREELQLMKNKAVEAFDEWK